MILEDNTPLDNFIHEKQQRLLTNVIKTGYEIATEKNAQISQKDAQIKQALLLAIEMGLKLKFCDEYVGILSEISVINDVKILERIVSQIPQIYSKEELRQIYTE